VPDDDLRNDGIRLLAAVQSLQGTCTANDPGTDRMAWLEQATELLDNLHSRAWSLESEQAADVYTRQMEAQRDEAIARRDIARLQLKLWRNALSAPMLLLDCLQDAIATLRQR
jgi:hypothetical protein